MKKTLLATIILIPLMANAKISKENTNLKINYSMGGYTLDGNIDTARIFNTTIGTIFGYAHNNYLKFAFDGDIKLETGTYERDAIGGNGPSPTNRLTLNESNITFSPFSFAKLKGGAINQGELEAPMLLGKIPFLAAKEEFVIGNDEFRLQLFAEQAYAKNKDLTSTLPDTEEGLPKFYAEGAQIYLKNNYLKLKTHIMHWAYENLGAGIATESVFRGNSAISSNAGGFTGFRYRYIGIHGGADLTFLLPADHAIYLNGGIVKNDEASDSLNTGYYVKTGVGLKFSDGRLNILGYMYDIESDASPAYYSDTENNKITYGGIINWENTKEPFSVLFSMTHSTEKKNSSYQSPENTISIKIGSSYKFL